MSTYNSIAWLPLCAGLTVLGLVLTVVVARRRGWRAMLRPAAWSLLPLAAYLTGSIEMFWKIGTAIGDFATAFVFSPEKWAGIGVAGLAVAAFLAGGGRGRRKAARKGTAAKAAGQSRNSGAAEGATVPEGLPATARSSGATAMSPLPVRKRAGKPAAAADDDMKDIEEILRKRGL
jgi:hypothetical protein